METPAEDDLTAMRERRKAACYQAVAASHHSQDIMHNLPQRRGDAGGPAENVSDLIRMQQELLVSYGFVITSLPWRLLIAC
jgi:hypothetical protein